MVGRKQEWELRENKQQLTQRMEELRERENQVTLILILIYLLILILGKIIFPVLIIVSAVQAGAGAERRSREQKRKKKARRNKKLKAPENKVSTAVGKKRKNGERVEDEDGGEEERPSREQLSLASDSVNERAKSLGSERKKIEKKKSSDTHGTHSVASMRRRRERGGCPDR